MTMTTTTATATHHAVIESPLGPLTVVADRDGVTGLYFPGHWTRPDRTTFGPRIDATNDKTLHIAAAELDEYFSGTRQAFTVALTPAVDKTDQALRMLLLAIPYGQTTTYGNLAAQLGRGLSPRDVGSLVGHNSLSILVPCHRVVGVGGRLTGYAGGLQRKRTLLNLERETLEPAAALW
jgi:methylated-DNA-[protein]-cysteine S-methyltransferase